MKRAAWMGYFVKRIIKFAIWMVFIFDYKGELSGIQSGRESEESSISTLFDNAPLPKHVDK